MTIFLTVVQFIAALTLIVTVLLQPGKSAGLSGTIDGGADQIFGKNKGLDALLAKVSAGAAIGFLVFTLILYIVG
jgi:preprotein translocase subunit SecG